MKVLQSKITADNFPFVPRMLAGLVRLYHSTCRFTVLGREHQEAAQAHGGPLLYTTWHYTYPAVIYFYRDRDGLLMVSRSRDGEWISRVLTHLGFRTARGSAGKGGATALREILSFLEGSREAGLMADGSQGPPCVAQKGILLLAKYSGAPLLPLGVAANPCWRFPTWDRTMLAKPFARVAFAYGPAIRIDRNASAEQMESCRQELESTLNRLSRDAAAEVGLEGAPWPLAQVSPDGREGSKGI